MFFFQFINNCYFIYKAHPLQNIYFNYISKSFINGNFPIDYWGLGNKKTIDYLLKKKKNFSISTSSYIQLENLKYYKSEINYMNIIDFKGTQVNNKNNSNFIFTNYFYNKNPTKVKKYQVPSDYKSYYKLKIGNIVVNEVFSKQ